MLYPGFSGLKYTDSILWILSAIHSLIAPNLSPIIGKEKYVYVCTNSIWQEHKKKHEAVMKKLSTAKPENRICSSSALQQYNRHWSNQ